MFKVLKRLVGRTPPPEANPDPFGGEARAGRLAAAAGAAQAIKRRDALPLVMREEVLDAKGRIAGYRFSTAWSASREPALTRATVDALQHEKVDAFAQQRMAVIPVLAYNWFRAGHAKLVGPRTVFLLDAPPPGIKSVERWREVCRAIRAAGGRAAVSGIEVGRDHDALLDQVDLFHLDFPSYSLEHFETAMARIRRDYPGKDILVSGLADWAERGLCVAHGAAYCMGPFTTSPEATNRPGQVSQSRMALIEMLNLLRRDADLAEITEVVRRHPEVALKVVAMANSPLQGLSRPVASIDQAVMILGRQELYRWLSIAMYRSGGDAPRDAALLELALSRGRFLELAGAAHLSKLECDELFLVGLLSLLDCMLGMPMARILEHLRLSDAMSAVLLKSDGPLARYLALAIALEKGQAEAVSRYAGQIGLPEDVVAEAWSAAFVWSSETLRLAA